MQITIPDPHPGRCLNRREGERCLDYDGHDSACTFPEKRPDPLTTEWDNSSWVYTPKDPEPWVSPIREE